MTSQESEAWRAYVSGLSMLDHPRAAQRFADRGPDDDDPGGSYYRNLWMYLQHDRLDDSATEEECREIYKFVQRAEAAGNVEPGAALALEAQLKRRTERDG